jgi:hypothetical protein
MGAVMGVAGAAFGLMWGLVGGALAAAEGRGHSGSQSGGDCRQVETMVAGAKRIQTLCVGSDGIWRLASDAAPSDVLSSDFRGHVSYSGTYQMQVTMPGPPIRRLDLRSVLRSVGRTRDYSGGYTVEVELNGNAVTGTYSGTGGIATTRFSGTRTGSECRLFTDRGGAALNANCTASRFDGTVISPEGERQPYKVLFEAQTTQLSDTAALERKRQMEAQAAAEAQTRQVHLDAARRSALMAAAAHGDRDAMFDLSRIQTAEGGQYWSDKAAIAGQPNAAYIKGLWAIIDSDNISIDCSLKALSGRKPGDKSPMPNCNQLPAVLAKRAEGIRWIRLAIKNAGNDLDLRAKAERSLQQAGAH